MLSAGAFMACSSADDVESELGDQEDDPHAGVPITGGGVTTGGMPGSGEQSATGGAHASGGNAAAGGSPSTEECTNVRPTGTEWDSATCDDWANSTSECSQAWMIDGDYCNESCGRCDGTSTGGSNQGSGGSPPVTNCNEAESEVCSTYDVGQHCGLTYEIWTDASGACMTNTSHGFRAYWDQGDGNYLARKGVRPGSTDPIVTYSADYNPNGNSYLGIYGWTQSPLIEYYIIDSYGSWKPPGTEVIGTTTSDGGTYEIYRSERVNKPSIEGNKTFWQYWSVRTEKRTSGTITVRNHFEAWEEFGLTLGSFYEVSLVVEGYNSSGDADVTVSFQ